MRAVWELKPDKLLPPRWIKAALMSFGFICVEATDTDLMQEDKWKVENADCPVKLLFLDMKRWLVCLFCSSQFNSEMDSFNKSGVSYSGWNWNLCWSEEIFDLRAVLLVSGIYWKKTTSNLKCFLFCSAETFLHRVMCRNSSPCVHVWLLQLELQALNYFNNRLIAF